MAFRVDIIGTASIVMEIREREIIERRKKKKKQGEKKEVLERQKEQIEKSDTV